MFFLKAFKVFLFFLSELTTLIAHFDSARLSYKVLSMCQMWWHAVLDILAGNIGKLVNFNY